MCCLRPFPEKSSESSALQDLSCVPDLTKNAIRDGKSCDLFPKYTLSYRIVPDTIDDLHYFAAKDYSVGRSRQIMQAVSHSSQILMFCATVDKTHRKIRVVVT